MITKHLGSLENFFNVSRTSLGLQQLQNGRGNSYIQATISNQPFVAVGAFLRTLSVKPVTLSFEVVVQLLTPPAADIFNRRLNQRVAPILRRFNRCSRIDRFSLSIDRYSLSTATLNLMHRCFVPTLSSVQPVFKPSCLASRHPLWKIARLMHRHSKTTRRFNRSIHRFSLSVDHYSLSMHLSILVQIIILLS